MSIRLRFTIWAAAIMLGILLALSLGIHYMMERNLEQEMDQRLRSVYTTLRESPDSYWDREAGQFLPALANPEPFASPGLYIQVLNPERVVVSQTENLDNAAIPVDAGVLATNREAQGIFFDETVEETNLRIYSAPLFLRSEGAPPRLVAFVQIAESKEQLNQTMSQLRTMLIAGTIVGTLLVAGAAWLVADSALRPLRRMAATARAIGGASDLSQRIASPNTNDEVEQLAATFNAMLDRLEAAFDAQRQFVADASHELRTPLTALRGNADILLGMVREGRIDHEILSDGLADMESEADRLGRLVQDLLTLARADVGWQPEMETVDLAQIVREAGRIAVPLAERHDFNVAASDDEVLVRGNADQLRQLLLILLDNAFTHTPPGASVQIALEVEERQALVQVTDSGPGFEPSQAQRLFDRFYRPDESRSRTSGGTGLGLAIARWIAEIHDGAVTATSYPDDGSTFTVRLPLQGPPARPAPEPRRTAPRETRSPATPA